MLVSMIDSMHEWGWLAALLPILSALIERRKLIHVSFQRSFFMIYVAFFREVSSEKAAAPFISTLRDGGLYRDLISRS